MREGIGPNFSSNDTVRIVPGQDHESSGPGYSNRATMTSLRAVFHSAYAPLERTERVLLNMPHLHTMLNQVVFFVLCDGAVGSSRSINCIYSLMLYHVLAYCFCYVRDVVREQGRSPYVHVSRHSNVRHLAMTATKLVLEWTKAVTVLTTIAFLVLAFAAREGLDDHRPTLPYVVFTFLHYIATEKTFQDIFPGALAKLRLEAFDSLEALWAPTILKIYTIAVSAAFAIVQIFHKKHRLAAFGMYVNVVLCWKDANRSCFRRLREELKVLGRFPDATPKQLSVFDDICSVCLSPMKTAKVTPCQHLFHANCLRNCLKTRSDCPICKRELGSS